MSFWIKLYKSTAESPYWLSEPFTRGQAWVDMLLLTNSSNGFIRKQGIRIELSRGDLGWSEVELAARWKWSRGKVRRFFDELEEDGMIARKKGSETDRRKFIITILNYSKYQDGNIQDGTGDDTSDGQATDRRRYKKIERQIDRKTDIKEKNKGFDLSNLPPCILPEVVIAFIEHRKAIKSPLTQFALELACKDAMKCQELHGIDPNDALRRVIAQGWKGCNPKYFEPKPNRARNGYPAKTARQQYMEDVGNFLEAIDGATANGCSGGFGETAQPLPGIGTQPKNHLKVIG